MTTSAAPPPPAAVADAGATAVDPAVLARWADAVPPPGPAADRLAAAAGALAAALHALLPAGRSGPLAEVLVEHWTGLGRGWAREVEEHVALVAATGAALAEVDGAYGAPGTRG